MRAVRRIASTTAADGTEEEKGDESNEAKSKFILKSNFNSATSDVKTVTEGPKPFKFTFGSTKITTNIEEEKKS